MVDLFADSYAIVALFEGNERYVRIFRRGRVVTSAFNVLEVYATLLRRLTPAEAEEKARAILEIVRDISPEVALDAAQFRQEMRHRRRDCSYVDAWGYAAARSLGMPFLTGDPSFKGVPGVEFVR